MSLQIKDRSPVLKYIVASWQKHTKVLGIANQTWAFIPVGLHVAQFNKASQKTKTVMADFIEAEIIAGAEVQDMVGEDRARQRRTGQEKTRK